MKFKIFTIALLGFAGLVSSCKKGISDTDSGSNKNLSEITVPSDFDWKTSHDVSLSIGVTDNRFQNDIHVVKIYVGDPSNGGQLVSKGSATLISPFNTKVSLPVALSEVYVVKVAPDESIVTQRVAITSTDVSVAISSKSSSLGLSAVKLNALQTSAIETSPDCNSDCGVEITSSNNSNLNLSSGTTYCVKQDGLSVSVQNTNGGTLRICGKNVNISGLKMASNITVIITTGASVTFNTLNWEGNSTFKNFGTASVGNVKVIGSFYNGGIFTCSDFLVESGTATNNGTITTSGNTKFQGTVINTGTINTKEITMTSAANVSTSGTITTSSNFNSEGIFTNTGTITVNGNFNSNGTPTFTTTGTLNLTQNTTIAGTFVNSGTLISTNGEINLNNSPTVTNSGTFTATNSKMNASGNVNNQGSMTLKNLTVNSGTFTNNCKLHVLEDFDNNSIIKNYSYIQVDNNSNLKGTFNLYDGAMFSTKYLIGADGTVVGTGTTSLFKVLTSSTSNVNDNGTGKFQGNFQYCDPSRTIKASQFAGGASQGCGVYIATNSCNTVGNGTPPVVPVNNDTDNDGVPNAQDDYPNDPTKAYNNYSINYANGGSTLAFEDNWPSRGDYDMNDVVLNNRYKIVTNAANRVVQISADFVLRATGADFTNAAGVQFHLPAGTAKNLTATAGVKFESNQDSVVVILFENSRNEQATKNTIPGEAVSPVKNYTLTFDVTDGPLLASFGVGNYNPFIWNATSGYGRGYETHLFGKTPTKLANTALFGTKDDNSTPGKLYSSTNRLPWAIELPVANFAYPIERVEITTAYTRFADWASSGGRTYTNWYSATEYMNLAGIYPGK